MRCRKPSRRSWPISAPRRSWTPAVLLATCAARRRDARIRQPGAARPGRQAGLAASPPMVRRRRASLKEQETDMTGGAHLGSRDQRHPRERPVDASAGRHAEELRSRRPRARPRRLHQPEGELHHHADAATGTIGCAGTLRAQVEQACVVTLEPVASAIDETFDVAFWPEEDMPRARERRARPGRRAADPEPIVAGQIAVGRVVFECLAGAIDPFPRKPDATLDWRAPPAAAGAGAQARKPLCRPGQHQDERLKHSAIPGSQRGRWPRAGAPRIWLSRGRNRLWSGVFGGSSRRFVATVPRSDSGRWQVATR